MHYDMSIVCDDITELGLKRGGPKMAENSSSLPENGDEDIPFMQRLLDSPLVLLALGVAIPTLLYIVWGVIEIAMIPLAN